MQADAKQTEVLNALAAHDCSISSLVELLSRSKTAQAAAVRATCDHQHTAIVKLQQDLTACRDRMPGMQQQCVSACLQHDAARRASREAFAALQRFEAAQRHKEEIQRLAIQHKEAAPTAGDNVPSPTSQTRQQAASAEIEVVEARRRQARELERLDMQADHALLSEVLDALDRDAAEQSAACSTLA